MKISKHKNYLILFLLATITNIYAGIENFSQDLKYANSLRGTVRQRGENLKPEQVLPGYSPSPEQGKYYEGISQSSDALMQKDAGVLSTQDLSSKTVKDVFVTRPLYTVNQNSQELQRSKLIEKDSYNIARGISDKYVDCTQAKACKTVTVEKKCNEAVRFLEKKCTKTALVKTLITNLVYPKCQSLVKLQGYPNSCPRGYAQVLYADMIDGPTWDDLYFCTKSTPATEENSECYTGSFYVARTASKISGFSSGAGFFGNGRGTVPKGFHARIRISNVYGSYMVGTINNVTKNETLANQEHFIDGQVIELPYSETEDQNFSFYAISQSPIWRRTLSPNYGVMVLYVDHQGKIKTAAVEWQEAC